MFFLYVMGLFFLSYSFEILASSSDSSGGDDCIIPISSRSSTPAGGSRLRSRGFSGVRLDLVSVTRGITPEHYDHAQSQIATQINQVVLTTPRTDRSKHVLLEQIGREIERQKNVLTDSVQVHSSSSEEHIVSNPDENLTHDELQNIIRSQNIANNLLTQMLVRQQDDREHADERVRSAEHRANVEAVIAVLGALFGFAGTVIAIVPFFIH